MYKLIRILTVITVFLFCLSAKAQQVTKQFDINSSTVFKDKSDNIISFETFLNWTSGQGYSINPVFDEQGVLKHIMVLEPATSDVAISSNEFGSTPELIEKTPPSFEAYDMNGQFISNENYNNKVIVLKFWFSACKPCIDEIPLLNNLVAQYAHNPDVVFLAPSLDKTPTIQNCLSRYPFNYTVLPEASDIAHAYNVLGYPTHVVINRTGKVEAVFQGVNHRLDRKLAAAIDKGLSRKASDVIASNDLIIPKRQSKMKSNASTDQLIAKSPYASNELEEEVLEINPNSVILDEENNVVPFSKFVDLMNSKMYELKPGKDAIGNKIIRLVNTSKK